MDWLGKIKGGINELEKLLERVFVKDHKILLLFLSERAAHFLRVKARLALIIVLFAWFLADMNVLQSVWLGFCLPALLMQRASEHQLLNHLGEVEVLVFEGINSPIPAKHRNTSKLFHCALPKYQTWRDDGGTGGTPMRIWDYTYFEYF